MARTVVAVMDSLGQREEVFGELLRDKGYSESDIHVISKDDEEADRYARYFEQGNYVVTVDVEKDLGKKHKQDPEHFAKKHESIADQGHYPHHHMKRGM
ncbi:hypothetical protein [Alteribacter populi]|uniref:hypothetical protein n=1 Tax=Alteribacter populi TaxID=2011011 RepID=UPI000BBB635B|nr:hypothetical protein [Alteribacter populi]